MTILGPGEVTIIDVDIIMIMIIILRKDWYFFEVLYRNEKSRKFAQASAPANN